MMDAPGELSREPPGSGSSRLFPPPSDISRRVERSRTRSCTIGGGSMGRRSAVRGGEWRAEVAATVGDPEMMPAEVGDGARSGGVRGEEEEDGEHTRPGRE